MGYSYDYDNYMMGHNNWIWMLLLMVLLLGVLAVVLLAVFGNRHLHHPRGQMQHQNDALKILDERLARGEIEPEEYRTRKSVLTGNG
ncbi:MAG: SHOCT domain-containing protein [Actinomycetota bacterium]